MSENDFVTIRLPRGIWERAARLSALMGSMSGNAVIVECAEQMMDLADAPPHERFTPKIVRMIDGARAIGGRLTEPTQPATRAEKSGTRGKHVVKGGRG